GLDVAAAQVSLPIIVLDVRRRWPLHCPEGGGERVNHAQVNKTVPEVFVPSAAAGRCLMRTSDVERKRLPQRQHVPPEFRQRSSTEFQAPFFLRDLAATAEFIRLPAESTFEHGLAG